MNKIRINQILEILLFPYLDTELIREDPLQKLYGTYEMLVQAGAKSVLDRKREEDIKLYKKYRENMAKYFNQKNSGHIISYDDVYLFTELFFPIDTVTNFKQKGIDSNDTEIVDYYLYNLYRIADSLLTFRDGEVSIRTWKNSVHMIFGEDIFAMGYALDKVEIWNCLSRIIVPDILIAAFCDMCSLEEKDLYNLKMLISLSDKLLNKVLQKGVAETHQHMNAGASFEVSWIRSMNIFLWHKTLVNSKQREIEGMYLKIYAAAVFRVIAVQYINYSDVLEGFEQYLEESDFRKVFDSILQPVLLNNQREMEVERLIINDIWHSISDNPESFLGDDYLLESVYVSYQNQHTGSEIIFLFQCLRNLKKGGDIFKYCFMQYLRVKNEYVAWGIERNEMRGLDNFQVYFRQSKQQMNIFSAENSNSIKEVLKANFKIRNLKKLEVRITPRYGKHKSMLQYEQIKDELKKSICKSVKMVLENYRDVILENVFSLKEAQGYRKQLQNKENTSEIYNAVAQYTGNIPTLGIVMHFLKSQSVDNKLGCFCWQSSNQDLTKYSEHRYIYRTKLQYLANAIGEVRNEIPYLSEYLVGIDAASNENAAEPWIMAPIFNSIRNRKMTRTVITLQDGRHQKIQNMGFTYHVGEEYRHILSGLRHIDEVIEQFHYKPGDRLGHALALGVNIPDWIRNNEIIAINVLEYMEDLLWIWGKMVREEVNFPIQIEPLEQKILDLAKDIFDIYNEKNLENMDVHMLYEAYLLKFRNRHIEILQKYIQDKPMWENQKTDKQRFCRYEDKNCEMTKGWNAEKILCTQYCPVFESRASKVVMLKVEMKQCELLEAIQRYLIEKVERIGIYVETNPTSNITIGDLGSLSKHPIFQLNAIESKADGYNVMLTINSDDPYIFQTNVENEIAYIYHVLTHEGYKKEEVLLWIDKIRQYGMESSFIVEVKSPEVILREVVEIINSIDSYLI